MDEPDEHYQYLLDLSEILSYTKIAPTLSQQFLIVQSSNDVPILFSSALT